MYLKNVKLIDLPKNLDTRGNLSFLQESNQIPFPIKRLYWIYDVPGGELRGGHSYHENQEIIICLSGSFDIILQDGHDTIKYSLNRSYTGLFVPANIWRHMENFSTNSFAFIVASTDYTATDYERDFDKFSNYKLNLNK